MATMTFDSLEYAKKLEKADFTRSRAETQATALREQLDAQSRAFQKLQSHDKSSRQDLATKKDAHDLRLEIQKIRAELKRILKK